MLKIILTALLLGAFAVQAQTPAPVPAKAVAQLQELVRKTQAEVVIGISSKKLPAETRPLLNRVLVQAASDFLALAAHQPTREAYYKTLDAGLAKLKPMMPGVKDREQVAEYFQDMLDIVGLDSSEGRLTAFVEGGNSRE
ncbi:MAG: DUF4844 domain-containing protein [Bacteroidota bacterium]|nr:DUF4844 domain-containing protein [Bacteroidota bacterium]